MAEYERNDQQEMAKNLSIETLFYKKKHYSIGYLKKIVPLTMNLSCRLKSQGTR